MIPYVAEVLPTGSVHLFAGAAGVGKTSFLARLCQALVLEQPFLGGRATRCPAKIGVITSDRPWSDHEQWFSAAGLSDVPHYSLVDDQAFEWGRLGGRVDRMDIFDQAVAHLQLPPDSLLILDTIALFLGGDVLNYDRVARHLGPLHQRCQRHDWTIIGTTHTAKMRVGKEHRYARPQDRVLGTAALVGCADTVLHLAGPVETETALWELSWHPHHAKPGHVELTRDEVGLFEEVVPMLLPSVSSEQLARVLSQIPLDDPISTAHLQSKALFCSRATVYRALKLLVDQGRVTQVGRGSWARQPLH